MTWLSTLPGNGVDLLHTQTQLRRVIGADGIEASIVVDLSDPAQSFQLKVSRGALQSSIGTLSSTVADVTDGLVTKQPLLTGRESLCSSFWLCCVV